MREHTVDTGDLSKKPRGHASQGHGSRGPSLHQRIRPPLLETTVIRGSPIGRGINGGTRPRGAQRIQRRVHHRRRLHIQQTGEAHPALITDTCSTFRAPATRARSRSGRVSTATAADAHIFPVPARTSSRDRNHPATPRSRCTDGRPRTSTCRTRCNFTAANACSAACTDSRHPTRSASDNDHTGASAQPTAALLNSRRPSNMDLSSNTRTTLSGWRPGGDPEPVAKRSIVSHRRPNLGKPCTRRGITPGLVQQPNSSSRTPP
jgi:hypothetical protein